MKNILILFVLFNKLIIIHKQNILRALGNTIPLTGLHWYLSPSIEYGQLVIGSNVNSFIFSYFQFPWHYIVPSSLTVTCLPEY